MAPIISVPAGRAFRRQGTNWVDPQPEKGLIELSFQDDLMQFSWKDRTNGRVENPLFVFPEEAVFEKVQQDATGRTHVLKFLSSNQKYFFWFQNASNEGDLRAQVDIHALLQDSTYRPGTAPLPDRPSTPVQSSIEPEGERSWPPTPGAPRLSYREPAPASTSRPVNTSNREELPDNPLLRMLRSMAEQGQLDSVMPEDARLTDVLSSSNISSLLHSDPKLVETLTPLLPPDLALPAKPTAEDLVPIISAPQFTDAIASLEGALRNGGLPGSMMTELGLPESAGTGVRAFLQALVDLGKGNESAATSGGQAAEDDRMDQD